MKLHTKRVVSIFKQVLSDIDELKTKGVGVQSEGGVEVVAYTSKTSTPNLLRHDVEQMIKELEAEDENI